MKKMLILLLLSLCGAIVCSRWGENDAFPAKRRFATSTEAEEFERTTPPATDFDGRQRPAAAPVDMWKTELRRLESLAQKDPDEAIDGVAAIRDPHERKSAAIAVCRMIAADNPSKALKAAWRLNVGKFADDREEPRTLEYLACSWADEDAGAALEWVGTLPGDDESRRDHLVKGIVTSIAARDPTLASRIIVENSPLDSSVQVDAAMEVLRKWSARDYAAALRWLSGLASPVARERGMDQLASLPEAGR